MVFGSFHRFSIVVSSSNRLSGSQGFHRLSVVLISSHRFSMVFGGFSVVFGSFRRFSVVFGSFHGFSIVVGRRQFQQVIRFSAVFTGYQCFFCYQWFSLVPGRRFSMVFTGFQWFLGFHRFSMVVGSR